MGRQNICQRIYIWRLNAAKQQRGGGGRGENGTGKSYPDRLLIPFYPTIYRFHQENRKPVRKREESLGCRNGNDFAFFLTVSSDPVFHPGITVLFPFQFPYFIFIQSSQQPTAQKSMEAQDEWSLAARVATICSRWPLIQRVHCRTLLCLHEVVQN